jgi:small subunit ribosomal protein S7
MIKSKNLNKKYISKVRIKKKVIKKFQQNIKFHKKMYIKFLMKKFINLLISNGKRQKAEQIFSNSLQIITSLEKKDGVATFVKAVETVKPTLNLRSIRRGGSTYQLPIVLRPKRQIFLALKWLIDSAKKGKGSFSYRLAQSFIQSSKNLGESAKKRENLLTNTLKNRVSISSLSLK